MRAGDTSTRASMRAILTPVLTWRVLATLHRARKEKEEIERRRNMTEAERRAEDRKKLEEQEKPKPKMLFMQKYYHKGAFYQDQEILKNRDYSEPTERDRINKELLPSVMRVKNFGRSGQTKYTHLADQDTSRVREESLSEGWIVLCVKRTLVLLVGMPVLCRSATRPGIKRTRSTLGSPSGWPATSTPTTLTNRPPLSASDPSEQGKLPIQHVQLAPLYCNITTTRPMRDHTTFSLYLVHAAGNHPAFSSGTFPCTA